MNFTKKEVHSILRDRGLEKRRKTLVVVLAVGLNLFILALIALHSFGYLESAKTTKEYQAGNSTILVDGDTVYLDSQEATLVKSTEEGGENKSVVILALLPGVAVLLIAAGVVYREANREADDEAQEWINEGRQVGR